MAWLMTVIPMLLSLIHGDKMQDKKSLKQSSYCFFLSCIFLFLNSVINYIVICDHFSMPCIFNLARWSYCLCVCLCVYPHVIFLIIQCLVSSVFWLFFQLIRINHPHRPSLTIKKYLMTYILFTSWRNFEIIM